MEKANNAPTESSEKDHLEESDTSTSSGGEDEDKPSMAKQFTARDLFHTLRGSKSQAALELLEEVKGEEVPGARGASIEPVSVPAVNRSGNSTPSPHESPRFEVLISKTASSSMLPPMVNPSQKLSRSSSNVAGSPRKLSKEEKRRRAKLEKMQRQEAKRSKNLIKQQKREEKMKEKEIAEFIELVLDSTLPIPRAQLLGSIPKIKTGPFPAASPLLIVSGPSGNAEAFSPSGSPYLAGQTVSAYPNLPDGTKQGDPVCDSYLGQLQENGPTVLCVADGCGWGHRSRLAAIQAKTAFVNHLMQNQKDIKNTAQMAQVLLSAIGHAHYKIIEGKEDVFMAGTTTLLGGYVCKSKQRNGRFMFAFISVGDGKAYRWRRETGRVTDLTLGSRNNLSDPKDPGGRLGPQVGEGLPDLRNIMISLHECLPGDILILTSDGVSDNFDPEHMGKLPSDCDIVLEEDRWDAVKDVQEAINIKGRWAADRLAKLLNEAAKKAGHELDPALLVTSVISFCLSQTQASRDWIENNQFGQLPHDFNRFPGKMDHTTCLALEIKDDE